MSSLFFPVVMDTFKLMMIRPLVFFGLVQSVPGLFGVPVVFCL